MKKTNEYRSFLEEIYGPNAVKSILMEDSLKIKDIPTYSTYKRVIGISPFFYIQGCTKCIKKGIMVCNQDFPNWLGTLNNPRFCLIGLEISPAIDNLDLHIAYENKDFPRTKFYKDIEKIALFFPSEEQFYQGLYVTDIAKCRSTNLDISRKTCCKEYLHKEIDYLLKLNPNILFIFQGSTVSRYLNDIGEIEYREDNTNFDHFKKGIWNFKGEHRHFIQFPHISKQTHKLWKPLLSQPSRFQTIKGEINQILSKI